MFNMHSNKNKKIISSIIIIVLVAALVLPLLVSVASAADLPEGSSENLIRSGITIGDVNVSGMTASQAEAAVEDRVSQMKQSKITFRGKTDDQRASISAGNLGMNWANREIADEAAAYGHTGNLIRRYKDTKDLERNGKNYALEFGFDKDSIAQFIKNNCAAYNQPAISGTAQANGSGYILVGGQSGYSVDEESSAEKAYEFLTTEWSGGDIDLDLDIQEQEAASENGEVQINDILGQFTTYYSSSSEERCGNIANGCSLITGTVLNPGEEFSVLKHLVPFTEENGYFLAGSYLGDEVVDSFGGGICQVSTTLYNAVIRAELKVTERYNHSMIVGYVDPSADAAIAESSGMDFRFVNNLDNPIYIEGSTYNKTITFKIYGVETRDPGRKISFESETLETIPTEGISVREDSTQPVGYVKSTSGHTGYKAQLWKVVTQDGTEVSRDIFNKSEYQMTPQIITVGTAGNVTDELKSAMETQDLATIQAAAEKAKNSASTEETQNTEEATAAAQEAAQQAYADALASGQDTGAAMEAAQQAANEAVEQATDNSDDDDDSDGDDE